MKVSTRKKHFVKTLDSSLSFEPNTNDYLQNAQKKTLLQLILMFN